MQREAIRENVEFLYELLHGLNPSEAFYLLIYYYYCFLFIFWLTSTERQAQKLKVK